MEVGEYTWRVLLIYFASIFVFGLGLIVGSFLNVVIYRLGTGQTVGGRSMCLACGKKLKAFELIPVLSFLLLRGRCSSCKTKISFQYPAVELLTGIIFILTYLKLSSNLTTFSITEVALFVVNLVVWSLLIAILVYDLKHKIIPPTLVVPFIALSAIIALVRVVDVYQLGGFTTLVTLDLLAGPLFYLFFYSLWKISRGTWMGLGDGNLALGIGLYLGLIPGLSAMFISFWMGAIVGLLLIALTKVLPLLRLKGSLGAITMRSEIPFAPFLIFGMAIVSFFNINVFSFF